MKTNIIIMKETNNMWFAQSLDSEVIFAQGKDIQTVRNNIALVAQEMAFNGQYKLSDIDPSNTDYQKIVKDIYGQKKVEILLSDIEVNEKWFISNINTSVRTNVSIKKGYKEIAKAKGINISDFLNKKLKQELKLTF